MPLELKIQIGIREATGAPVFLRNDFAGQWRKVVTKGTAPRAGSKEMSIMAPRLNRCDVLPCVAFVFTPPVPMMRGEEYRYARGTSGLGGKCGAIGAGNRARLFRRDSTNGKASAFGFRGCETDWN